MMITLRVATIADDLTQDLGKKHKDNRSRIETRSETERQEAD